MSEWNETYHVTGRLSNAFHIAGDATTRIIDELFPFMQDQPIHHQAHEDAQNLHSATPVVPAITMEETDLSPSAPEQSVNPPAVAEEKKKSESPQSDTKPECSVCQQTHNVQGRKRAKATLPTTQYPTQYTSRMRHRLANKAVSQTKRGELLRSRRVTICTFAVVRQITSKVTE